MYGMECKAIKMSIPGVKFLNTDNFFTLGFPWNMKRDRIRY